MKLSNSKILAMAAIAMLIIAILQVVISIGHGHIPFVYNDDDNFFK